MCSITDGRTTNAASSSRTSSNKVRTSLPRQRQAANPTVNASNTLVVKRSGWSVDPSRILESAKTNDQITSLHFIGLHFEERAVFQLIQLLESRQNISNKESRASGWNYIFFSNCHFPNPSIVGGNSIGVSNTRRQRSNYILPSSKAMTTKACQQLACVLAQTRVEKLLIQDSVHLTAALLEHGSAMPNVKGLTIQQRHGLSNAQCQALGKLVSCSKQLKELSLRGTPIPSGALLAPGLAISYHLETLILGESYLSKQSLNDLVLAAPDRKAINYGLSTTSLDTSIQATYRLLCSPRSNLSALDLSHLQLNDKHMEILAPLLADPESKLEQLNLSFNQIGDRGLAIFCQHLPKMRKLSKVSFNPNPWRNGKILCDAMKENTSVEYLDSLLFLPEAKLLRHYSTLNRGGRRLLEHQRHKGEVPLGLWANALERAGKIQYFVHDQEQAKANAVYHLLSNGPVFFDQP